MKKTNVEISFLQCPFVLDEEMDEEDDSDNDNPGSDPDFGGNRRSTSPKFVFICID